MTTATITDENEKCINERPGAQLAAVRIAKGISIEDIAGKLHLRSQIIRMLEADDYSNMPSPVFVKGYLRAYAKLIDINADAILEIYHQHHLVEQKSEKSPLWQARRDTSKGERVIRWLTTMFGLVVLVSVAIWWKTSQDNQTLFAHTTASVQKKTNQNEYAQAEIRLTDLSTMRSLLSSETPANLVEKKGE